MSGHVSHQQVLTLSRTTLAGIATTAITSSTCSHGKPFGVTAIRTNTHYLNKATEQLDGGKFVERVDGLSAARQRAMIVREEAIGIQILTATNEVLTSISLVFEKEGEKVFTGTEVAQLIRSTGAVLVHDL